MQDGPAIRPLEGHEWKLLRELRLRALREAPDAFGPTAAEAESRSDDDWREGAARFAQPNLRLFVARDEAGGGLGLISAVAAGHVGHLGAMWVDPAWRGRGVGRRLFAAACDELEAAGCERIELSVTEGNERAIALYQRFGFALTGRHEPLREGSTLRNLEMARDRPATA